MRNFILKSVTGLAFLIALLSMCAMDSEYWKFAMVSLAISGLWLGLFYVANKRRLVMA